MIGTVHAAKRQDLFIRGTANRQNAIADMEIAKRRIAKLGINLHRGFEDELVIFGHSLGAAEATILGMLLSADGWRVTRVYAPRRREGALHRCLYRAHPTGYAVSARRAAAGSTHSLDVGEMNAVVFFPRIMHTVGKS